MLNINLVFLLSVKHRTSYTWRERSSEDNIILSWFILKKRRTKLKPKNSVQNRTRAPLNLGSWRDRQREQTCGREAVKRCGEWGGGAQARRYQDATRVRRSKDTTKVGLTWSTTPTQNHSKFPLSGNLYVLRFHCQGLATTNPYTLRWCDRGDWTDWLVFVFSNLISWESREQL